MNTVVSILMLLIASTSLARGQQRCDGLGVEEEIFKIVEQMPTANMTKQRIAGLLNERFPIRKEIHDRSNALIVTLIVNCNGQDFNYTIVRSADSITRNEMVLVLDSSLYWTAGEHRNEPVDVSRTLGFDIKNGEYAVAEAHNIKTKRRRRKRRDR